MNLDFKEIPVANKGGKDQDIFELFACDFLESLGYEIIQRPSRGPDGKKDLIVRSNSVPGNTSDSKIQWLVSCKHKAHSDKGVSDVDEPDIIDRLEKHKCHGFLGFYSTIPNSTLSDKLANLNERFVSTIYDHSRIEKEIHFLKDKERILTTYFPKSKEKWKFDQTIDRPQQINWDSNSYIKLEGLTLLETIRTAQIQLELLKLKRRFSNSWEKMEVEMNELFIYYDYTNEIIAKEIIDISFNISNGTRSGMPSSIAETIYSIALHYFPSSIENEHFELRISNGKQLIYSGYNIVYDSLIHLNNLGLAKWGLNIWKFIYRESVRNNYTELIELVKAQYKNLESTLNRPEREDLENAKELVKIFKKDLDTYSLAFPYLPEPLYTMTLK